MQTVTLLKMSKEIHMFLILAADSHNLITNNNEIVRAMAMNQRHPHDRTASISSEFFTRQLNGPQ